MRVERFTYPCIGHQSHLILDEESRVGAIVDPQPDVLPYLAFCEMHGYSVQHVFLTQVYRDFESGHRALAGGTGGYVYAGRLAEGEENVTPVRSGDVVEFGRTRLVICETPSFSPESISLLAYDLTLSQNDPLAIFPGRLLSVGDIERPDADAWWGEAPRRINRALHESLRETVLTLPDWTHVYPSRHLGAGASSTIGDERIRNHVLWATGEEELYDLFWGGASDEGSEAEGSSPSGALSQRLRPVSPDELVRAKRAGAQILDVRSPEAFAAAHLVGSLNIPLEGPFSTCCRTVVDRGKPILLVAPPARELEAAIRFFQAGLDQVAGYLKGGMAAMEDRPRLVRVQPRLPVSEASSRHALRLGPTLVDVRELEERGRRPVEASISVPLERIPHRFPSVPDSEALAVFSERGYRSSVAASLLGAAGLTRVSVLIGGAFAWARARRDS